MSNSPETRNLRQYLEALTSSGLSPLDFLPEGSTEEKIIGLALNGSPPGVSSTLAGLFHGTLERLSSVNTDGLRVVTLGGGTGLSNIVGGDSRRTDWQDNPFTGLKEIFSGITSIVCVTDDGGSTGELLKYLPLVGLGDLRHVLVSSVRRENLRNLYRLDDRGAGRLAATLHRIFN
ncbi:MAG TPA: YvcK family protein, partial [Desulfobacteraceae bacterium]|nr:YvcK family protein [Desulfobacteraceae bacterium]